MGARGYGSENNDAAADLIGQLNNKILKEIYKNMRADAKRGGTAGVGALVYYIKLSNASKNEYGRMELSNPMRKLAVDLLSTGDDGWRDASKRKAAVKKEIALINTYYKKYASDAQR